MRKVSKTPVAIFFLLFLAPASWLLAQTVISGTVTNSATGEALVGANIQVKDKIIGTISGLDGKFTLTLTAAPPHTLVISYVGYDKKEVRITDREAEGVQIQLVEKTMMSQEVVVSASRVEETLLQSPVSVEKMDIIDIRNTASPGFYDAIENMKGVQVNTGSLTYKSINTRGFSSFGNVRFVQVIDGMDNQAPGLNFAVSNMAGVSDLDVESVELVPGAASALYGPNAFNGILFIHTKSPFNYQGLSAQVKGGVTSQDAAGTNPFGEIAFRYAKAFKNKFAFKINFSGLKGEDWHMNDYRDVDQNSINAERRGMSSPSYDGLNLYGDEIAATFNLDELAGTTPGALGNIRVARTGYKDKDLVDYNVENIKGDVALHFRPANTLELIYGYRIGYGSTVYQANNRNVLDGFVLQQHKLELKGDNFFIRGYKTIEDAGDSYDSRFAAFNINRAWKSDQQWFQEYLGAFLGQVPQVSPFNHNAARAFADRDRLQPGTPDFEEVKATVLDRTDLATGSKFVDNSTLTHIEGNYNFKNQIDIVELQVGGNFRRYNLDSEGTLFNDADGPIGVNEYGAYTQLSKMVLEERLKFTGSIRFDKHENFKGQFSPRASLVYALDVDKQHYIRGSFQTGFRNPDTQAQYIALDLGVATLVGGTEDNIRNYTLPVNYLDATGNPASTTVSGIALYNNSYTAESVLKFMESGNPDDLTILDIPFVEPEQIRVFEIGYRGVIGENLFTDVTYYHNRYRDFQANINIAHVLEGDVHNTSGVSDIVNGQFKVFQLDGNANGLVTSHGLTLGLDYALPRGFRLGGSYSYASFKLDKGTNPALIPGFNTPEHRFKLSFSNRNLLDNLGYALHFRWSDSYLWESGFGTGTVEAYGVLDLQFSYKLSSLKTIVKLGGANLLGKEYTQAFGSPPVGAQYYISLTFDEFFN